MPPSLRAFSSTTALAPQSCATMAAPSPPRPEPTDTKSDSRSHLRRLNMTPLREEEAAVDEHHGAGDVGRHRRRQEQDRARHVVRLAHPLERNALEEAARARHQLL